MSPLNENGGDRERRVLLVAPTRRDAEITCAFLNKAGMRCVVCRDLVGLAEEIGKGAGAVLLTEEAIASPRFGEVVKALEGQPTWSDLPIVVLTHGGGTAGAAMGALRALRNVTLLDRPAPIRSVVSAVQTAVRARVRQYEIRDQIEAIRIAKEEREQLLESERAARQEAERVGRVKDEFLATLSHELRTPLSAIFGWTQLLKMKQANTAMMSEGIDVIDRNVRIQTQLVEDLLDISRIVSGKVRLEIQGVEIGQVIEAALESVMPALNAKEIRLERMIDPTVGPVSGDFSRLQQIFWNLLINAVKFTAKGGTIQVRSKLVRSYVEISVSDDGEGIDPKFLPRLFDRFSQADSSTRRKHGGLGLGLSIVRNLVEMHGGEITAHSEGAGKGATFTVYLPVRAGQGEEKEMYAARSAGEKSMESLLPQLRGLRVLIVDDDVDARELLRRFLVECEAVPAVAASAAEAQVIVANFVPDVIISDIGMPVQDGYEFMREVRGRGLKMPAVALTAFARPGDRVRSIQAGYQVHLAKPVAMAELMAVVASLAGRYEAVREE